MGEVWRARDHRLHRDVAIKVLPEAMANSPSALARFEREARAVAALSHPNILAIHDFGNDNGVVYAVIAALDGLERAREERNALLWARIYWPDYFRLRQHPRWQILAQRLGRSAPVVNSTRAR